MKPNIYAFTLIELLVVVLIIGILATVAVPQYQKAIGKTRAMQALTIVKTLSEQIEQYYRENGIYPPTFTVDGLNSTLPVSFTLPSELTITGISDTYIGVCYKNTYTAPESFYMISRILLRANSNERGKFVCSTAYHADNALLPSKICKSLCQTTTLKKVWGSGEFGCVF